MSGATKEDEEAFKQLLAQDPECKKCFECDYPYPQWCSYTHGIFICLECSGKHRGLGTHLVAVRSSTMDGWSNWKPEKLRQMQLGGNKKARLFFDANNIPKTPLKARYEHPKAQLYRAKLEAAGEGRPFDEASFQAVDYAAPPAPRSYEGSGSSGSSGGGNRYGGQGSGSGAQKTSSGDSEWMSALSSGWNTVSSKASSAVTAASKSLEGTAQQVTSKEFKEKVSKSTSEGLSTVSTGASKAWGSVAFFATSLASTVKKSVAGDDAEEDGLGGLTRNVQRSSQPMPHVEHVREDDSDGLRSLTSGLQRSGQCKYEGIGSDGPSSTPPPAPRAVPQQSVPSPTTQTPTQRTPVATPTQAQPAQKKSADGWDDDW